MDEAEATSQFSPEMEATAARKAKARAKAARWDLDVAVFFFAVLIIVVILLFQEIRIEVVAPVATVGLALGWLMGWKKGKEMYQHLYDEELTKLFQESKKTAEGAEEETIEEKVQKALRERWR